MLALLQQEVKRPENAVLVLEGAACLLVNGFIYRLLPTVSLKIITEALDVQDGRCAGGP